MTFGEIFVIAGMALIIGIWIGIEWCERPKRWRSQEERTREGKG